jgi:hypothetical protein
LPTEGQGKSQNQNASRPSSDIVGYKCSLYMGSTRKVSKPKCLPSLDTVVLWPFQHMSVE